MAKGFKNGRRPRISVRDRLRMVQAQAQHQMRYLDAQHTHDEVFSLALSRVLRVYAKHAKVSDDALLGQVGGTYKNIRLFVEANGRLPKEREDGTWEDIPAGDGVAASG